jgi:hypothetical protein
MRPVLVFLLATHDPIKGTINRIRTLVGFDLTGSFKDPLELLRVVRFRLGFSRHLWTFSLITPRLGGL